MTRPPHAPCRLLILFFCISALAVWGQDGDKYGELEKRLTSTAAGDKLQIFLQLINRDFFPVQDIKKCRYYSRLALELARDTKDRRAEGLACQGLAYSHFKTGDFQQSLLYYFQSREAFTAIADLNMIGLMNFEIGNLFHYCYSDCGKALDYYTKSLGFYEKSGDIYGQVKDINIMGEVYRKMGNYEGAVSAYVQALRKSESADSSLIRRKRAIILVNLSDMYALLEDYSQSRAYLDRAETIYRQEKLTQEIGGVLSRRGDISRSELRFDDALQCYLQAMRIREQGYDQMYTATEMHKIAETLSLAGKFTDVTRYFQKALRLRRELSDFPGTAQTLLAIGIHCKRMHSYDRAFPYFQESLDIAQKKGLFKELQDACWEMAEFMAWKKDRGSELSYRKLYEDTRKRIQSPKITAKVMKIMMEYEKEAALGIVAEKKKRTLAYALAAFALLAVAIFFFILHTRRIKKRAKKTIQFKENQLVEQQSQLDLLKARLRELETPAGRTKYRGSRLSPELEQVYLEKLIKAMETDRIYKDSDLTLDDLARRFNVNRSYLSQAINHSTGKSFLDFINSFRIEEAKRLIRSIKDSKSSILEISLESGYNSKAAFNRIFKKLTGMTPGEYRKEFNSSAVRGS